MDSFVNAAAAISPEVKRALVAQKLGKAFKLPKSAEEIYRRFHFLYLRAQFNATDMIGPLLLRSETPLNEDALEVFINSKPAAERTQLFKELSLHGNPYGNRRYS